jgi:3-methyladenine DNA glycosylase/8-oxoguanine DNA glycosylase
MTLDNWSDVARQVMAHNPASFIGFFAFIIFTAFFVVNLVVAVICETLIHIKRAEEIKSGLTHNVNEQTDFLLREVLKSQIKMQNSIQELTEQLKKQGLKEA